ncbi:MAG: hypothetical protein NVSMB62_28520 [Acidobacteriaceae bacterium]
MVGLVGLTIRRLSAMGLCVMQLDDESERPMNMTVRCLLLALCASGLVCPASRAAATGDVTAPIRQFIDGFNKGDTASGFAAFGAGDITIVDEFAPHLWTGANAAHAWAADYEKHTAAAGVSDGVLTYKAPTRVETEGDLAYVVIPTAYRYKDHGKATAEEGQMTFVLHSEGGGWKIRAWTWTGVKPHPAK